MAAAPEDVAPELAENMREEQDHVRPWTGFAASLGVDGDTLAAYEGLGSTRRAVSEMTLLASSGYGTGACAMYAFEKEIPKISRTKMDGLAEFYGIDSDDAVEYFVLHTEADVRHAASWRRIIDGLGADARDGPDPETARYAMLGAARRSLSAQHALLDGCMDAYCGGSGNRRRRLRRRRHGRLA